MNSASNPPARSRAELLRAFFFVNLVALQFGIDSTLWLPTVFSYISTITAHRRVHYYLSLAQLLPSAVQVFVSLLVGPIVALFTLSLKWSMVVFILLSFVGNFLYSCAGPFAINNVWALIGGRMLAGLASGSSALAMSYIVSSSSTDERLESLSQYRSFAGVAFVIGPVLSIPLTTFSFHIGRFPVDQNNAPTFVSSFIAVAVALITCCFVRQKRATQVNFLKVIVHNRSELTGHSKEIWAVPLLLLLLLFLSAFLMANVFYTMSDLMRSPDHWNLGLTLISGLQAIVFLFALIGSLLADSFRRIIQTSMQRASSFRRRIHTALDIQSDDDKGSLLTDKLVSEVVLSACSFLATVLGCILSIISLAVQAHTTGSHAGSVACFLIACTIMMAAYNIQAATLPSLYSKCLPAKLRTVLTPWYGATVALGKLAAPPIIGAIGVSRAHNNGWIASQALCIAIAFLAIALQALFLCPLIRAVLRQSR
ncbi:hypothetical protein MCUN1_000987 [Malassezia cuniculi]|uniref:Uncharacterized protein n=1 Tax=Malassezia cuniculi TaxID=948313 RepID=A0AAF0ETM1_9BASI|nr:hypothetical protein MCUN1_000987 [Malassezia cuniculi]